MLRPASEMKPKTEQRRIEASGVCPLFVRPNVSAIFLGRYCWESMKTARDETYIAVFLRLLEDYRRWIAGSIRGRVGRYNEEAVENFRDPTE